MKLPCLPTVLLLLPTLTFADALSDAVIEAYQAGDPGPIVSRVLVEHDASQAYQIQSALVAHLVEGGETITGYKAALTSTGAQQKMGVSEPAAGVLFESGVLSSGATLKASDFNKLMVETEMGYYLSAAITEPIQNLDTVKTVVSHVAPIVEYADAAFGTDFPLKVFDIIASNAGARGVIVGNKVPISEVDPNAVLANFYRDDELISEGAGSDAMGNQWEVLRWVINTMLASGHTPEPGNLIITGSMGAMQPGSPGTYRADFEGIEKLGFSIED